MASVQGNTNQQPRQRAPAGPRPRPHWKIGEIAFLKRADAFNQAEWSELIESRRIPEGATGHPVIILARSNDSRYYIVTTVSAYSSSEQNNYLPPWRQSIHERKYIDGFRAFKGSARPNDKFEPLHLADNKSWPKVETSWVYIYHTNLVLATTLTRYTKSRGQLQMEPTSLQDLLGHMEAKSWNFREQKVEMMAKGTLNQPNQLHQPAARNLQQSGDKENVQGPVIPDKTTTEQPKLNDITNAAVNKPLYSQVAAMSTKTVACAVSQPKGHTCNVLPRSQRLATAAYVSRNQSCSTQSRHYDKHRMLSR